MNIILFLIILILGPVPIFHFLLHKFLNFWQKNPYLFYLSIILIWILSGFIALIILKMPSLLFITPKWLTILSESIIIFSLFLILWSIKTLGVKRYFLLSVINPIKSEIKIIKSGPYKLFKHPAYLAYCLISISIFLISAKLSILFFNIYYLISIIFIIRLEERELKERLIKYL